MPARGKKPAANEAPLVAAVRKKTSPQKPPTSKATLNKTPIQTGAPSSSKTVSTELPSSPHSTPNSKINSKKRRKTSSSPPPIQARPSKLMPCSEEEGSVYSVDVSNRFEIISDTEQEFDSFSCITQISEPDKKVNNRNFKPPPIIIKNLRQNATNFFRVIKSKIKNQLDVKCTSNEKQEKTQIKTQTVEDYKIILNLLKENKLEFYTFGLKNEIPFKITLKGLHSSVTPDEILEELKELGHHPISITQLTKKGTKIKIPIFILKFSQETEIKNICNVKTLCYTRITWERYKANRPLIQCFKCQAYGHISINCFLKERCLKCSQGHKHEMCNATSYTCANCGLGHLANDPRCQVRTNYLDFISTKSRNSLKPQEAITFKKDENNFPKLNSKSNQAINIQSQHVSSPQVAPTWPRQSSKSNNRDNNFNNVKQDTLQTQPQQQFNISSIVIMFQQLIALVIKLIEAKDATQRNNILREEGDIFSLLNGQP